MQEILAFGTKDCDEIEIEDKPLRYKNEGIDDSHELNLELN